MAARVRGSSPLTRGKLAAGILPRLGPGLIPAHAGKTVWVCGPLEIRWAHPRSRGENIRPRLVVWENVGSSPLTRGKHAACVNRRMEHGLIPAHAGKTMA